jgi:hypothetical protein
LLIFSSGRDRNDPANRRESNDFANRQANGFCIAARLWASSNCRIEAQVANVLQFVTKIGATQRDWARFSR